MSRQSAKDEPEDQDDDEEEYSYRVFFRREEIRMANEMQSKDMFADLINMKINATQDHIRSMGPNSQRINILEHSPKKGPSAPIPSKKNLRA
mmetsp:Transcript_30855/g.38164  ORF Transcript_30855/g.38164 Transcript_30855/m.38164 type:complete len:92 (-) Transcript_30855:491-766(-)